MARYTVEAVSLEGKRVKVEVEANSTQEVIQKLRSKGYRATSIKEKPDGATQIRKETAGPSSTRITSSRDKAGVTTATRITASVPTVAPPRPGFIKKPKKSAKEIVIFDRVTHKQLTQFTSQLSILLNAGLPVVRSLKILDRQMRPSLLKRTVGNVAEDVEGGSSLSEALGRHPKIFDRLYVNMVKAGEAGGVLDVVLQRLSTFQEKVLALRRKLIGASIYPAVVLTVAVAVLLVVMTVIVPKFEEIFEKVGAGGLPPLTAALMSVSQFLRTVLPFLIFVPIILFIVYKAFIRTRRGRYIVDRLKISLPLFGIIIKKAAIARFSRTLGTLLQSGVPILEALRIVRGAAGNEVISSAIERVHSSIKEGESIADPLAQSGVFDEMVRNMIEVGEETGELDKMLLKIADIYDSEVDAQISAFTSVLEPFLILGLGGMVGLIVVSLFLPLIGLIQQVGAKTGGGVPGM